MKQVSTRFLLIWCPLALLVGVAIHSANSEELTKAEFNKLSKPFDIESLSPDEHKNVKAESKKTGTWIEFKHKEQKFSFRAMPLPSYGTGREKVQGWVFRTKLNRWDEVIVARLANVGEIELKYHKKDGKLIAVSKANNKLKNKPIITFALDAT